MIVARILPNGYFGGFEEYPDGGGIPYGTTRTLPPEMQAGQYAVWVGTFWNITTDEPPPPPPPPIPDVQSVSLRQARRILFTYGYLDAVNAYIDQLPSPDRELAQIDWEYATEVRKDSDLVVALAEHLSLTSEQLDTMFYEASLIP